MINKAMGTPLTPWRKENGKHYANIGNYCLDYAYSGVKLVQMDSDGGGIRVISTGGYGTKRDLYNWMTAFLAGIDAQ